MWITQPVTIGVFLRVISISHDEKADSKRDKDTPKKGLKRGKKNGVRIATVAASERTLFRDAKLTVNLPGTGRADRDT